MAGELVLTPSGGSAITYSDAVAATQPFYTHAGKYVDQHPVPGNKRQAWQDVDAPGVDGLDPRPLGTRGRLLGPFRVWYVGASENAVATAFLADLAALDGKAVEVQHPTAGTFANCRLVEGRPVQAPTPAGSVYWMQALVTLEEVD